LVTIITDFSVIHPAVAAPLAAASIRTPITNLEISVVTFFKALLFWLKITAQNSITAARQLAPRSASVSLFSVAIVTSLITVDANLEIDPLNPVTAARRRTGTETRIGIFNVTIITNLTLLNDAITAARWDTIIAPIGRIIVGIITTLIWTDNSITAACKLAVI